MFVADSEERCSRRSPQGVSFSWRNWLERGRTSVMLDHFLLTLRRANMGPSVHSLLEWSVDLAILYLLFVEPVCIRRACL